MSTDGRSCANCRSVTKASAGKPYDLRFTIYDSRSAAVSSSTSRSTLQAPDAFELPTRCGWSSTQPRSVNRKSQIASRKSILVLVENLPVPLDRRVWQEACVLRDAG